MTQTRQSLDGVVEERRAYENALARKKRELGELEGRAYAKLKRQLTNSYGPVVVAFVDLCGSTELKREPQEKWLPIVAQFLLDITKCVRKQKGHVIKYIGDEILAIFDRTTAIERSEAFVRDCEVELGKRGDSVAKYALDIGRVVRISVPGGTEDVLGACVDRCARIAKLLSPGTALASADFVAASQNPSRWIRRARIHPKGVEKAFDVFQLDKMGTRIKANEIRARAKPSTELKEKEILLSEQLSLCRAELNRLRRLRA